MGSVWMGGWLGGRVSKDAFVPPPALCNLIPRLSLLFFSCFLSFQVSFISNLFSLTLESSHLLRLSQAYFSVNFIY